MAGKTPVYTVKKRSAASGASDAGAKEKQRTAKTEQKKKTAAKSKPEKMPAAAKKTDEKETRNDKTYRYEYFDALQQVAISGGRRRTNGDEQYRHRLDKCRS